MRRPLIAGNWKMNTTVPEATALAIELRAALAPFRGLDLVVCPPFVSLYTVADALHGAPIEVGAQNMYHEEKGAFTGEISPLMLVDLVQYVILGHSERRQYFGETDRSVNLKLKSAQAHALLPIVCVGERLEEHEAGETGAVVTRQVRGALAGVHSLDGLVIAYEPVWAIGTGRAATGDGANATIGLIRRTVAEIAGAPAAERLRILYGGSVSPANIAEFMAQPEIDGALVGGASLKAADFTAIVRETARVKRTAG